MKWPRVLAVAVVLLREARGCRQWQVRCEMVGRSFRNANPGIKVVGQTIAVHGRSGAAEVPSASRLIASRARR
jgi:hypothetical protein